MEKEDILKIIEEEGNIKEFQYEGFECKILRPGIKDGAEIKEYTRFHLCGYVKIPKEHKLYKEEYSNIDEDFDVHGGITFSNYIGDDWYIGFDCAHSCDLSVLAYKNESWAIYKDMKFVENELKKLVEQIKE